MPFVHGHARDSGWVVSHYRRPQSAGSDQLDLATTGAVPEPRATSEPAAGTGTDTDTDTDDGTGPTGAAGSP